MEFISRIFCCFTLRQIGQIAKLLPSTLFFNVIFVFISVTSEVELNFWDCNLTIESTCKALKSENFAIYLLKIAILSVKILSSAIFCLRLASACENFFVNFFWNYVYSLIFIRQNYNFDMLAMIWHEIVCWFLKIYQDLWHRIVFVLIFRCAEQFYVPNMQEQSKVGKFSEINKQFHVKSWLTYRNYSSVW